MQPRSAPGIERPHRRDTGGASLSIARALMVLAAVGALAAAVMSIQAVRDAEPDTVLVETWRLAGLVFFSGLFALLAYRPGHYAGVWELVIVNKLALTLVALTYASDADEASGVALVDGILALVLIAAYVLGRAWRAWSREAPPGS